PSPDVPTFRVRINCGCRGLSISMVRRGVACPRTGAMLRIEPICPTRSGGDGAPKSAQGEDVIGMLLPGTLRALQSDIAPLAIAGSPSNGRKPHTQLRSPTTPHMPSPALSWSGLPADHRRLLRPELNYWRLRRRGGQ